MTAPVPYNITLSNGVTNFNVYPLETDGLGNLSTPRQILQAVLTGGAGVNYFQVSGDISYRMVAGFAFNVIDLLGANGYQFVNVGSNKTESSATNLVPVTTYTATITIDGVHVQPISVLGSTVTVYRDLVNAITSQLGGFGTAVMSGGNLQVISATNRTTSTVSIVNSGVDPLFAAPLNGFVAINAAVPGTNGAACFGSYTVAPAGSTVDLNNITSIPVVQVIPAGVPFGYLQYNVPVTHTSLQLPGRGTPDWGLIFDTDLVHHLENFAKTTPPVAPLVGQLWYDSVTGLIKFWNGFVWSAVGGTQYMMHATTVDATPTKLVINDVGPIYLTVPVGNTWKFDVHVSSRETVGANVGFSAAWHFEGCIKNIGGVVSLVGIVIETDVAADDPTWMVTVTADNTFGLVVTVTGIAATTIHWKATVHTVEVT